MERNPDLDFSRLQTGASVPEVVQLLGPPHEAWASLLDPQEMVWVYRGLTDRSLLFFGSMVVQVFDACLGGAGAFSLPVDVKVNGQSIELHRR